MRRWTTAFVIGILFATGSRLVAEEEADPFADVVPPVVANQSEPLLAPAAAPMEPVVMPPIPRRQSPLAEPTAAQQRVHERAALEARQRKARIEQRKHTPTVAAPAFFPTQGPLGLYPIDHGIRIGFRPITLSGIEPLPSMRPTLTPKPRTEPVRKPATNESTTPRE